MSIKAQLTLSQSDLNEAVKAWLVARGFVATGNFSVVVRTVPGDRPFDGDHTEITVLGVSVQGRLR